ncbi:hypothetical protein ACRXB1_22025, partial [Caballeronia sp. M23-90]
MKPLLRVVLVVNALIFLAFGVLFLLSPWGSLWESMHLVRVQPPLIGQLLGVALIGFAWLGFHAAIDGALTATAAKVSGHVEWLSGLILIVWLGLRMSEVTGFGQLLGALIGFAWLGFHAAIDGALTATAAKVSGHVEWLSGLILIVWLGLRMS